MRFLRKPPLRRSLLVLSVLICSYLVSAAFGGCSRPVAGVWPPPSGEPRYHIIVSVDRWHSVIGLWPEDDRRGQRASDLEEWGYAEKSFYLEKDTGCSGTCEALLLPTPGILEQTRAGSPWSERTPQPPARQWSFWLSREGYERLRAHLQAERAEEDPVHTEATSVWWTALHRYHALHNCHHWTARALRRAGLPVWSFFAPFKWSLEAQLDRAARMAGTE